MLNQVSLQGRLVANPELFRTQSGTAVASMRLAVDRDFKDKSTGERETDFISVTAWGGTAEMASKYFAKGRMMLVSGRLQIRNYTDKEGNKRTAAEVVAQSVYFGDSKQASGGDSQGQRAHDSPPQDGFPPTSDGLDSDLPF